jgi:hypothetical protein
MPLPNLGIVTEPAEVDDRLVGFCLTMVMPLRPPFLEGGCPAPGAPGPEAAFFAVFFAGFGAAFVVAFLVDLFVDFLATFLDEAFFDAAFLVAAPAGLLPADFFRELLPADFLRVAVLRAAFLEDFVVFFLLVPARLALAARDDDAPAVFFRAGFFFANALRLRILGLGAAFDLPPSSGAER